MIIIVPKFRANTPLFLCWQREDFGPRPATLVNLLPNCNQHTRVSRKKYLKRKQRNRCSNLHLNTRIPLLVFLSITRKKEESIFSMAAQYQASGASTTEAWKEDTV